MGVVYRAFDAKTRSDVALKAMRDIPDPAAVELFSREWSVLAGMSHPNIVDVRDVGEIEEKGRRTPFFVMPLLSGSTLAKLIEISDPRLSPAFIVEVMLQVCRGLQAAHERGLIHRDLKPSNIFVLEDDTAKIIDFGVVHLADAQSVTGHKGTWQYMAPEVTELQPATAASDIFSLGVICYEAITGRRPFARRTAIETVEAIRKYTPPPLSDIRPNVTPALAMAVHKAMAKQPAHRFTSARELAETLRRAQLGEPIERFEPARIQPRIIRARNAFLVGDHLFSREILSELQLEGYIDPEIGALSAQVDEALKQGKVRQLLNDARARLEQDEVALAMEKLREILGLDPENADARWLSKDVELQRTARQVESWLAATRRHLDRGDFNQARQSVREALAVRPGDARVGELLREVEERERASARTRAEREHLYDSAVRAYHKGELNAAIEKMEKVLALTGSGSEGSASREAVYQSFYNQVRAEREAVQSAYAEARRFLAAKEFAKTLDLCERFLAQFPGNPLFQSLRLEATESQRREMAAYVADVHRRLEEEDDLDNKVVILHEAVSRFPEDPQFQERLKLARDRRDLVQSIVAKARQYDESNQFDQALGQWDLLRDVCPRYPGLAFEIERAARRREWQEREDTRLRLVEKLDFALETHSFEDARELARAARDEYPSDEELRRLERLAEEGVRRELEVRRLLEESQAIGDAGRHAEQDALIRRAMELDDRHPAVRAAAAGAIIEQARAVVDEDWRRAEALIEKAAAVDGAHPALKNLRLIVADARRKEEVSRCLAEARDLQRAGDPEGALAKVTSASASYPNDRHLEQYTALVKNLVNGERQTRQPKPQTLTSDATLFSPTRYGDSAPPPLPPGAEPPVARETPAASPRPRLDSPLRGLRIAAREKARAFVAHFATLRRKVKTPRAETPSPPRWRPTVRRLTVVWLSAAAILSLGFWIVAAELRRPVPVRVARPTAPRTQVAIATSPPDAVVTIDGQAEERRLIDLATGHTHVVTISKPGYVPLKLEETVRPQWKFDLAPEPVRLRILTGEQEGSVFLDGRQAGELTQGAMLDLAVPVDGGVHKIGVSTAAGELFSASFAATAGGRALLDPIETRGLIAVSSLGNDATVYSGTPDHRLRFGSDLARRIPSAGLKLALTAQNRQFQLMARGNPEFSIESGNGPILSFWLTGNPPALPYAIVRVDAPDARLYLNNQEVRRSKGGYWRVQQPPGAYALKIVAEGFFDYEDSLALKSGEVLNLHPELKPKPDLSALSIVNGTPGAEVLLAGKSLGRVDDKGVFSGADIPPGEVPLELRRSGYEPKQITLHLTPGQTVSLANGEAALRAFGKIEFQISPAAAKVQYREGDTVADGRTSGVIAVPARRYRVTASADGYEGGGVDVNVQPGETAKVAMALHAVETEPAPPPKSATPALASLFQDGTGLRLEADGWTLSQPGIAWLVPGIRRFIVSVVKPDRGRLIFMIETNAQNSVDYEFSGRRVSRTSSLTGKRLNVTLLKAAKTAADMTVSVLIEQHHIAVEDAQGGLLDELNSDSVDFTAGKVGVEGDAHFVIRSH